ncbi:DNA methyltransferase [Halomarina oriensis]|uniref:Type II methyltransferase n=1 Tax=Halomarina oriensis TaxID=671145 RepID=A0A6B0GKX0_9EURY|nr:DNA methylase [Halomarina oriensis]
MQSHLHLTHEFEFSLPERFDADPRTPESYVEHFLSEFTAPGDTVLDPFAGFGTTLRVAERMGREAYGIEYDADHLAFAREQVEHPERIVHGDALDADSYVDLPPTDCCLTSPPYTLEVVERDPLTNYTEPGEDYEAYLADLGDVFEHVESVLRADGHLLVDVANLQFEGAVTTLAWDVARVVGERFWFEGEVVVTWEAGDSSAERGEGAYGYGYDHSYCLVFAQEG